MDTKLIERNKVKEGGNLWACSTLGNGMDQPKLEDLERECTCFN